VPAGVYLFLLLFPLVVQSVFLVDKLLAAVPAHDYVALVGVFNVIDKLVVTAKLCMAVVALVLFAMQKANHGENKDKDGYKAA
jgi:hypothetical protein